MELWQLFARYGGFLAGLLTIIIAACCLAYLAREHRDAYSRRAKRAVWHDICTTVAVGGTILAASTVAFIASF